MVHPETTGDSPASGIHDKFTSLMAAQRNFGWKQERFVDEEQGLGRRYEIGSTTLEVFRNSMVRLTSEDISVSSKFTQSNVTEDGITFQRKASKGKPELDLFVGKAGEIAILQGDMETEQGAYVPRRPRPTSFPPARAENPIPTHS